MTERDLCPDAGTWKTFLDGDVLDDAAAELAGHLENCEACQQTLERLAAGKETWEGTAKQLADADAANAKAGIESSGHLQSVLDDLKLGIDVGPSATASSRDVLRFLEPSDEPGSIGRLDSYEILEVVGAGGMGVVLRGWDPTLRRVVAIKVLAAHLANSAAAERRFVREAQAAAAVSHDHVVAIHAVGAGHEPPYLVMQFVEGKTLQQRLDRTGPLNVNEILRIGQQTALGLAAAHRQGIVHRDIKPANILLENGVERVRITDFGLARAIDDASMTQSGVVAGTPLFMAPEQAQGQPVDHRSDLFSLGSVLYAMATGRPPFRSSTMKGVIRRVCDDQPRPIREINPDIPDWLCGIIDHLLAKNPAERFQSADEVAELLAGCLAHVQRPLSVRLPAMATAFAPQSTRVDEPEPTIAFQSPPQGVAEPATAAQLAADDVDATARALMKWPATLLFIVGLVDLLTVTVTLLYLMARFNATGSFHQVVTPKLWMFVPCGLCMIGAIRMGSLRSRVWSYVAIVAGLLSWPGIILGLPVGLWSLHRLGHPEVVAAFKRRPCSDWRESEIQAVPLTFGQELARVLIIALMWLMAIAIPLVSYVLAQDSGAFPNIGVLEKTMLSVAALAVIFGLASTLKHLERRRKAASGESEIRSTIARQIRRIPEVLICTLLTILTMQAIYADLSATNYDGIMEAAVVPLFCVTLVTLGVVVFINRRRIRELKATGQEDSELTSASPTGHRRLRDV
jgi:serine/threonine protein kinase